VNTQTIEVDARKHWDRFVAKNGGIVGTADLLKMPYSTIASICNGTRGIGHEMARNLEKRSDGVLNPILLVWMRQRKKKA
jgi:hypothetical protein